MILSYYDCRISYHIVIYYYNIYIILYIYIIYNMLSEYFQLRTEAGRAEDGNGEAAAKGSRRSSRFDAFVIYAMGNGPLAKPSAVRAAAISRALQAFICSIYLFLHLKIPIIIYYDT